VIFLGQIELELKKTKWNKISDFLSSLFLVYQVFWLEGDEGVINLETRFRSQFQWCERIRLQGHAGQKMTSCL
jgi:hypothetical protein